MAVRRESVELSVTGNFASEMTRNAAAVALLRRELDGINGHPAFQANSSGNLTAHNRQVAASANQASQGMQNFRREANYIEPSINKLTGRLSLLADTVLTIGPALIPIGALAGPAIGGLAAAATAAATAGGSAMVAFLGLGDAVKAVQDYQLEPTYAGLEKAREAMRHLGPDAQRFVVEFQKFRPVLSEIKGAAEAGWFPGLTESLDGFARLGPKIEDIFFTAGQAGGFLVDGIADSLASDRWTPFLDFIEREVPTAMGSLTTIMGGLTHGAAEMFMALDPGSDSFLSWMEDVANGFDNWASSSDGQDSIQDFLEYARQNGPLVADLFASLVGTLAAVVKAAAPLGGPILVGLTAVSDMIGVIADSDMATPILAGVAALRLFNRTATAATAISSRWSATGGGAATAAAAMIRDPNAVPIGPMTQQQAAFVAAQNARQRAEERAVRNAARRSAAMKGAGMGLAGGLLMTGAAEDIGLTNTAMMTMMGTIAGPWGAALGAAAGLSMDAAAANNDLTDSLKAAGAALASGDMVAQLSALADVQKKQADFAKDMDPNDWSNGLDPGFYKNTIEGWFGNSDVEEGQQALEGLEHQMRINQEAAKWMGDALGMTMGPLDGSARSAQELTAALEAAKPAMDALGVSQEDLFDARAKQRTIEGGGMFGAATEAAVGSATPFRDLKREIADQAAYMDSAQGKADNYVAALGRLVREEGTAAERAKGLNDALSALLDPSLNAEAALDRYRQALKEISNLNVKGGFTPKTETGRTNRAATRDFADSVKERLATMVEAGRTERDVAGALGRTREQFIKSGEAAGFSAQQMRRRATAIGLTPKLVETTFVAAGITKVDRQTWALRDLFKQLPRSIRTEIRENGALPTKQRAKELIDKLDLVGKPRRALMRLVTEGEGSVAAAKRLLESVSSKTVTLTTRHINITENRRAGMIAEGSYADGGFTGPGGKDEPAGVVHRGEVVIPQNLVKRDWSMLSQRYGHLPGFADGGMVGRTGRRGGGIDFDDIHTFAVNTHNAGAEIKKFHGGLKAATAALQKEKQQRQEMMGYRSEVGGSLAGELTGGGLAGFDTGLAANRNDAKAMLAALRKAKKKGLSGPLMDLVAASGDLSLAQQMADLTRAGIAQRERQYGSTIRTQNALGGFAAGEKFNETLSHNAAEIANLRAAIRHLRKDVRDGAREGVGQGTNRARRDRSRSTSQRARVGR